MKIYVKKEEVKHKYLYMILGTFVHFGSLFWSLLVWDDVFFGRSRWLTRKNLLKYLQDNRSLKIQKNYESFTFELEDKSELILWLRKTKEISYHIKDGGCVLTKSPDLSCRAIDRQIIEILSSKIEKMKGENEKSI